MTDERINTPLDSLLRDDDEHHGLPEHEHDDEQTLGGGVMASGGTAIDRGTGTVDDDAEHGDDDRPISPGVVPGAPSGGAQPYVPALIEDDEDGGVLPDA